MMHLVLALDGPAASGKSTISRRLADELKFVYVDTGAMYRAFTWIALEKGIDIASREAVARLADDIPFETTIDPATRKLTLLIDGKDPGTHIRGEKVNSNVSKVASVPELREYLVIRQRQLRNEAPLVMEGRDIGTVVFTDTPFKFFLDADPAVREQRRQAEGGQDTLSQRDRMDRSRVVAPLIRAADAELIDTGGHSVEELVQMILKRCDELGLGKIKQTWP